MSTEESALDHWFPKDEEEQGMAYEDDQETTVMQPVPVEPEDLAVGDDAAEHEHKWIRYGSEVHCLVCGIEPTTMDERARALRVAADVLPDADAEALIVLADWLLAD